MQEKVTMCGAPKISAQASHQVQAQQRGISLGDELILNRLGPRKEVLDFGGGVRCDGGVCRIGQRMIEWDLRLV